MNNHISNINIYLEGNFALSPKSSSILRSWLYFAILSDLDKEPVLICPTFNPTAISDIVVSSVSPDLWDTTAVHPESLAKFIASMVSVNVPIWLGLIRIEFALFSFIALCKYLRLVTNKSSPTSWHLSPIELVNKLQPSQSFSSKPSSILSIG